MHRDGGHGCVRRLFKGNVFWNERCEVSRYKIHFGMTSVAGPGDGYPVSNLYIRNAVSHILNYSGCAVSQRQRLVHLCHHVMKRIHKTLRTGLVQNLSYQVRPLSGFANQAFLCQVHDHLFGAGTDNRSGRAH